MKSQCIAVSYKKHLNSNDENGVKSALMGRLIDFFAGSTAGAVQVIVAHPFDTVKVKEQAFPNLYKNMLDCFIRTYRTEGFFHGLYAGCVPALIANVGENAVLLVAYESCRKFVGKFYGLHDLESLPIAGEALAGGLSTSFSVFVVCPTELVKCRIQAMNDMRALAVAKNKPVPVLLPMGKLISNIYFKQGILGFYRGLSATFARDFPGYFCFFGCYEGLKEYMKAPDERRANVGPLITILAAGIAGVFLWVVSFPADVIKSRIQINNLNGSLFSVGRRIVCKDGIAALYHGLLPTMIQSVPATAVLFVVYEYVKKRINKMVYND